MTFVELYFGGGFRHPSIAIHLFFTSSVLWYFRALLCVVSALAAGLL